MARILDTTPTFETYARKVGLESPAIRRHGWREAYEGPHREVFDAFYAREPSRDGLNALVTDLSGVRKRVPAAATAVAAIVDEIEPLVRQALGVPEDPAPLHVLMVGPVSTNALVGRLGDDVALFHCLEWYQSPEGWSVLVAHEDTHAWHQLAIGAPGPEDDMAWMAFAEGLAVQVSRQVAPGRPDEDYFWYGFPGFTDWLSWCKSQRQELLERFRSSLDDPKAVDTFFGAGMVDSRLRVGYFLADSIVAGLGRPLDELVRLSVEEGRSAVRDALSTA
jgi:hypothetical protein